MAAYSVGQQIAIAAFTASVGLGAVVFIFRFRSFKEVLHAGRASREAEREAERAGLLDVEDPAGAQERPVELVRRRAAPTRRARPRY